MARAISKEDMNFGSKKSKKRNNIQEDASEDGWETVSDEELDVSGLKVSDDPQNTTESNEPSLTRSARRRRKQRARRKESETEEIESETQKGISKQPTTDQVSVQLPKNPEPVDKNQTAGSKKEDNNDSRGEPPGESRNARRRKKQRHKKKGASDEPDDDLDEEKAAPKHHSPKVIQATLSTEVKTPQPTSPRNKGQAKINAQDQGIVPQPVTMTTASPGGQHKGKKIKGRQYAQGQAEEADYQQQSPRDSAQHLASGGASPRGPAPRQAYTAFKAHHDQKVRALHLYQESLDRGDHHHRGNRQQHGHHHGNQNYQDHRENSPDNQYRNNRHGPHGPRQGQAHGGHEHLYGVSSHTHGNYYDHRGQGHMHRGQGHRNRNQGQLPVDDYQHQRGQGHHHGGHQPHKHGQENQPYDEGEGHPHGQYNQGQRSEDYQGKQRQQQHDKRSRHDKGNQENQQKPKNQKPKQQKPFYEPYMSIELVKDMLKREQLLQGTLRINPRNYEDAYIPHPDGVSDVYISGMKDRNRALNGDTVAVLMYPRDQWKVLIDDLNAMKEKDLADHFGELSIKDASSQSDGERDEDSSSDVIIEEVYYEGGSSDEAKKSAEVSSKDETNKSAESSTKVVSGTVNKDEISSEKSEAAPSSKAQTPNKKDAKGQGTPKGKENTKGEGQKQTPNRRNQRKRFTSLGDLATGEATLNPVLKRLFDCGEGNKNKEVNQKIQKNLDAVPKHLVMRTGKVVFVIERKHSRACTGHLRLLQDKNPEVALFSPLDSRLPRLHVPMASCPQGFYERPGDHAKTLFIARITDWDGVSMFARGEMARSLGEAGEIEPETDGILIEYDIDTSEFPQAAIDCLPQNLPWTIPQSEFAYRRDLRKDCIFTIDPATARDLDDALSCKPLGNGRYEVGVHIADVSHFVSPQTALDQVAADRATSVYMVQKVIPMLPRLLCEQLCSLNPDEDRLTFSVIWTVTEDGVIEDEWFGRSVIRSCVKLAYDHAQGFIDDPDRVWTKEELPPISEGYSITQIKTIVLQLHKIAVKLRKRRHDNGALRLDQVKLQFTLDKESGLPNGYFVYRQRDSNKLVEEFMLLANMAVARKIYNHYKETAVLRRHPPPQSRMIDELSSTCKQLGVPLDVTSSKSIAESLAVYAGDSLSDQARLQILTVLCSKPMQNARYFCTGCLDDEELYRHYALNVPFYTHFTSPIRRYPDIMVHRLLAATLGYSPPPSTPKGEVMKQCEHCNDKKTDAKTASEKSNDLFFSVFIKECGPLEEQGMVMGVLNKSFDVLVLKLGVVKRVYCEKLPLVSHTYQKDKKRPVLTLNWAKDDAHPQEVCQIISVFTHVQCRLYADDEPLKWSAIIKHPEDVPM